MSPLRLFVYGTLRPGREPAALRPLLAGARRLGAASTPGRVHDLGAYPGAVPDAAAQARIEGEVLELPDDPGLLAALDAYEGYDPAQAARSLFLRRRCRVQLAAGGEQECWIYVYRGPLPGDARR